MLALMEELSWAGVVHSERDVDDLGDVPRQVVARNSLLKCDRVHVSSVRKMLAVQRTRSRQY